MRPWVARILSVTTIGVAAAAACEPQGSTDGSTNWLGPCEQASECVEGLSCICGTCSRGCSAEAHCSDLGPSATCHEARALATACDGQPGLRGVCTAKCTTDNDCPVFASTCNDGLCWIGSLPEDPDASGSGGSSGDGGTGGVAGQGTGGSGGNVGGTAGSGGSAGDDGGIAGSGGAGARGGAAGSGATGGSGGALTDGGAPDAIGGEGGDAPDGNTGSIDAGTPDAEADAAACVPPRCAPGLVLCDGYCIDPSSDERHCGATDGCGVAGGSTGATCAAPDRCLLGACAAACVNPPGPSVIYGDPDGPMAIDVGDLNHDQELDLVTANAAGNDVTVFLGQGNGAFSPAVHYAVGSYPLGVAIGDTNADGHPDVVAGSMDSFSIDVLLGTGPGNFRPDPITTPIGVDRYLNSLAMGDVDGDCLPDVIVCASEVYLHRGNGDGTFAAGEDLGLFAKNVALADLNGDAFVDLALAGSQAIQIAMGGGDGTFGPAADYPTGAITDDVTVGDLSRDGIPDLVVASLAGDRVSVLFGNGNGTFGLVQNYPVDRAHTSGPGYGTSSVGIGDLDGDGDPDVAAVSMNWPRADTLLNDGTGTLVLGPHYSVGSARDLAVGDFDGDGRTDFASGASGVDRLAVVFGESTTDFADAVSYPVGTITEGMAAADLDGKNGPDIVLADYYGMRVNILFGNGDGTFQPVTSIGNGERREDVAIADFDEDSTLDIVATNTVDLGLSVFLGNGNGTFKAPTTLIPTTRTPQVTVGDMNGDTHKDLVASFMENSLMGLAVLLGNGDGTFQPALMTGGMPWVRSPLVADVNSDGLGDVVYAEFYAAGQNVGSVSVRLGNGDGTLGPQIAYLLSFTGFNIAMGRLNGDAHLDVLVDGREVLLGTGDSTGGPVFQLQPLGAYASFGDGIALADFDNDGSLDAVGSSWAANQIDIRRGNGAGQFSSVVSYVVGAGPHPVVAEDFNGDGLTDVATANVDSNDVSVVLGVPVCKGP